MKPNNAAQRCTAIFIGEWWQQIGPGKQEMRAVIMASVGVLGFISFSPTYKDRQVGAILGWHLGFVGTLLIAFATSVPEMVVIVAALRVAALNMAIGNLLGSNLFNILIFPIVDILYLKGPVLSHISSVHAISAMSAIIMTGIFIIGLFYRAKTRFYRTVGWASLILFSVYLINSYVLYIHGG